MDTLWLAGEMDEFARCLRWVTSDMDLDVDQVCALVFEYGLMTSQPLLLLLLRWCACAVGCLHSGATFTCGRLSQ